jgi:hypothetical protein
MTRRAGFTLLEICLVLFIGLLLISIAVPGIAAVLREQKLKRSFDEFDTFVHKARQRSVEERRAYALVWDDKGVALVPIESSPLDSIAAEESEEEAPEEVPEERYNFGEGNSITLERPFALMKDPPAEWVFWRSGLCEQVVVSYTGEAGSWTVRYDPLTVRGTFIDSSIK